MSKQAENTNLALDVYPRLKGGKNAAYRTRVSNLIPAVIYGSKLADGKKSKGLSISLDPKNFLKVYQVKGRTTLVDLALKEGAPQDLAGSKVLIKDLQTHVLRREVLHVDILQLDLKKPIRVSVPLRFVGKAKGIVDGGILSIMSRQVEIKCLPADIPHEIDVDVSDLAINQSLHIHQLAEKMKGAKYEFIFDSDYTLCAVAVPEEEKTPTPEEAAAAAGAAAPAEGAAAAGAAAPADGAAAAGAAAGAKDAKPAKDAKK